MRTRLSLPTAPRLTVLILTSFIAALSTSLLLGVTGAIAGTITVIDGVAPPAAGVYTDGWIQTQLAGGDFELNTASVGIGPDDIIVQPGAVITWTTGSKFTLRAQNNVLINGQIQHSGPENGAGGLHIIADDDGNGQGAATIGSGSQLSPVKAGSQYGLTRVEATDLLMNGGASTVITYTSAILGYYGVGSTTPYTISGPISVTVANDISATGGVTLTSAVQIGHGVEFGQGIAITTTHCIGSVHLQAGGDVVMRAGPGKFAYAQVGNGSFTGLLQLDGSHIIRAGGLVEFSAGAGDFAYAQFGNGGFSVGGAAVDELCGNHFIDNGGPVRFIAGEGLWASVQLGNGGFSAIVFDAPNGHSGSHTIRSQDDVLFAGDTGTFASAQLGNGGFSASVSSTPRGHIGDHSIRTDGNLILHGGEGPYALAQIGNGGFTSSANNEGNHTVVVQKDVTMESGGGAFSYVRMGNGAFTITGYQKGDHKLVAMGDVHIRTGTGSYAFSHFGNGVFDGDDVYSGNLELVSSGSLSVTSGITPTAFTLIGHGGYPAVSLGERSGDISLRVGKTAVFSDAIVGHVTASSPVSVTQGNTLVGVSLLDPYASGQGKLIARGATTFTSASDVNGGELRFYLPRQDSQQIDTSVSFNGEFFTSANTIPPAQIQGQYLFGEGPYSPKYSFYLGGQSNVQIVKSVEPAAPLNLGDTVTYKLAFENTGPTTALDVTISDELPQFLRDATVTLVPDSGVTIVETSGAPDFTWDVSNLPVGLGGEITLQAVVKSDPSLLGRSFENEAIIAASGDITPDNNRSTVTSTVNVERRYLPGVGK